MWRVPEQPGERGSGPGVEDQSRVAAQHQHDVGGGVWADTRQGLQLGGHLVIRQGIASCPAQGFEVDLALSDGGG